MRSSPSFQHLVSSASVSVATEVCTWWYLPVVSMSTSPVINDVKQLSLAYLYQTVSCTTVCTITDTRDGRKEGLQIH